MQNVVLLDVSQGFTHISVYIVVISINAAIVISLRFKLLAAQQIYTLYKI